MGSFACHVRRLVLLVTLCVVGVAAGSNTASAQTIDSYEVDVTITRDATMRVVEERRYVGGVLPREPIVRELPSLHFQSADSWLTQREIIVSDVRASQGSTSIPVTVTTTDEGIWQLTLASDLYTASSATSSLPYRLEYTLTGALAYYKNRSPELYFDAISHRQNEPIRRVVVTLHDPEEIFSDERSCYFGPLGGSSSCGLPVVATSSVVFATRNLAPDDGLTISQGLRSSGLAVVTIEQYVVWKVAVVGAVVVVLLSFVFWPLVRPRRQDAPETVEAALDSTPTQDSV